MKIRYIIVVGMLVLLGLGCRYFHTCGRGCDRGGYDPEKKAEYFSKRIKSKLDLDQKQANLVEQFKKEYLSKKRAFHKRHKEGHAGLVDELRKGKPDANVIRSIMSQKDKHRANMRKFLTESFIKLHAILRPEQQEKLADFIEKKMQKKCHRKS